MLVFNRKMRWLILALALVSLDGCLGGSIAQQLARSIVIQSADKITSDAYDAKLRKEVDDRRNVTLKDTVPDEYWAAFITSGFSTIKPTTEPLPAESKLEESSQPLQSTRLVRVEMWNLLIGEEKRSVLEKGRLLSASSTPPPSEWKRWQVATGAIDSDKSKSITFLIPPEFGKITSGEGAFVELAGGSELNIARYPAN